MTTGSLATPPPPYLSFGTQAKFANRVRACSERAAVSEPSRRTAFGSYSTPVGYAAVTPANEPIRRDPAPARNTAPSDDAQHPKSSLQHHGIAGPAAPATSERAICRPMSTSPGAYSVTARRRDTMTTARAWGARWTTGNITRLDSDGLLRYDEGLRQPDPEFRLLRDASPGESPSRRHGSSAPGGKARLRRSRAPLRSRARGRHRPRGGPARPGPALAAPSTISTTSVKNSVRS